MSDYERNKGKLIPTGIDTENFSEEDFDNLFDNGYVEVDGEIYKVEWEIRRGDFEGFAEVSENEDGSIDFHTYHYNGGAHWSEVVENALNKGDEID